MISILRPSIEYILMTLLLSKEQFGRQLENSPFSKENLDHTAFIIVRFWNDFFPETR